MSFFNKIIDNLPEVVSPTQKHLSFKEKMIWTGTVLVLFFALGLVPLFGLGENALQRFEYLSMILGAKFGSLVSLGIGPIVTASIVLQLLNGAEIIHFKLDTPEGKKSFQGWQKLLAYVFTLFEASVYVFMGGLAPSSQFAGTGLFLQLELLLVFQLFLGGVLIMFMDEVVSKWGFGSGVSLFIVAGVSESLFIRMLSPIPSPTNPNIATGAIPALFQSLAAGDPTTAFLMLASVAATIVVFVVAVYMQAMKVEIPLSFGRVRGQGMRWPLDFAYASVIPVILVSALLANIQLWARLMQNWGYPIFGRFIGNTPVSGIVAWIYSPNLVEKIIKGNLMVVDVWHMLLYMLIMIVGCAVFSIFWVQTSGMDAGSQAKNITNMGFQVPGFRRDERVLERLLQRYIGPLTIMGGIAIGLLSALADVSGALSHGTGILLSVMIIYQLYQQIAKEHMMDMNPMLRKFME